MTRAAMNRTAKGPTLPSGISDKRSRPPVLETLVEAEARNLRLIDELVDREPDIAVALEACCPQSPCGLPGCGACSDEYLEPFNGELLRVQDLYEGPHEIATIFLATFPAGSLAAADIDRAHDRLRKKLERSGFAGSILIGGTEAGWSAHKARWIFHLHLLAIGVPKAAWVTLRAALGGSGPTIPLKVQPLRDTEYQTSYVLKFVTCHWPGKRGPVGRGGARPLPPALLAELATWWCRYRFEDFVFMFGAKRFGGRIVPVRRR
jgi:hypothetical protein